MIAKGNVRSTLLPPKKPAGNARGDETAGAARRQGTRQHPERHADLRRSDQEGGLRRARRGCCRAQTTINADKLTLDEAKGDLTATGKVITNLVIANKKADPGAKPKPTIARAETFTYSDDTRKATYTTGRAARWRSGQPQRRQVGAAARRRQRTRSISLEATGAVTAIVDKRTVTGARLTYSPDDDKYIVVGAPVKMIDAECQETSGKTLTFWKASDRVQVDGNNEVRTQTKGGGKCPRRPLSETPRRRRGLETWPRPSAHTNSPSPTVAAPSFEASALK